MTNDKTDQQRENTIELIAHLRRLADAIEQDMEAEPELLYALRLYAVSFDAEYEEEVKEMVEDGVAEDDRLARLAEMIELKSWTATRGPHSLMEMVDDALVGDASMVAMRRAFDGAEQAIAANAVAGQEAN